MSVLLGLTSHLIQRGHVDELTLHSEVVHLLHSVWVALSTVEYVAGHVLTGGVEIMAFTCIITFQLTQANLKVPMWMVCH